MSAVQRASSPAERDRAKKVLNAHDYVYDIFEPVAV
jgi:hypothetical protein